MKKALFVMAFILLFAFAAYAESDFRCGNSLISIGVSKYQVLGTCGPPVYREVRWRYEEWVYLVDWYGNRSIYVLTFRGSKLVEIYYAGEINR